MFIKIHDCCIINTDHVVWVDVAEDNKMTVKMTDGLEHVVKEDKFSSAMGIINQGAKNASYIK